LTLAPGVLLLYGDQRWNQVSGTSEAYPTLQTTYKPQAYLEGSASLIADEAEPEPLPPFEGDPAHLYQDFLPAEVIERPDLRGWFTVVDSRGRVRWAYKEWPDPAWAGWLALVLVSQSTPPPYLAYLQRETIPYLVAGQERVDLALALAKMHDILEVKRLLSTSPGRLGAALLRAGLVDEIHIEFFPAIIGGYSTPSLFDSPELGPEETPHRLRLLSTQTQVDGRVWLRYEVLQDE
jgi:hypothetical protein